MLFCSSDFHTLSSQLHMKSYLLMSLMHFVVKASVMSLMGPMYKMIFLSMDLFADVYGHSVSFIMKQYY